MPPAAETTQPAIMTDGVHHGIVVAKTDNFLIIVCAGCGFKHALPLPEAGALLREYEENYYSDEKPDFIAHAREDEDWFELAETDRLEAFETLLGPGRRRLL